MRAARAPSKLNDPAPVPTTAPTDSTVDRVPPPYGADAHFTAVPDVHDELLHAMPSSSDVVPVGSFALKFIPKTPTEPPPDGAMLDGLVPVGTGAAQTRNVPARAAGGCVCAACAPS